MGVFRTADTRRAELEEFHEALLATVNLNGKSDGKRASDEGSRYEADGAERLVCVTSGVSYLGLAIVNRLLSRGYSVRLAVDNEEDLEKLREMDFFREVGHHRLTAMMVKLMDLDSLCEAFDGCRGVFHTSSFVDAGGLTGYTKWMAEMERRASEAVIEACARTPSVRKCVVTSSLLACIWRTNGVDDVSPVLDESCWSEEGLCRDRKLWYALGKTMAEKAAWRVACEREVRLATICPGLITGPGFLHRNSTASIAFLKGAKEMYAHGLLATVDVARAADAHINVYEETGGGACGRYICFDRVINQEDEAIRLEQQMGMPGRIMGGIADEFPIRFELYDGKLSRLMSRRSRCYGDEGWGPC